MIQFLKEKRAVAKISQKALAEQLGLDRSTIAKIESTGKTSVSTAKKLGEALNFDWTLFFK